MTTIKYTLAPNVRTINLPFVTESIHTTPQLDSDQHHVNTQQLNAMDVVYLTKTLYKT